LIDECVDGAQIDSELILEKLLNKLHGDGSSSVLAGSMESSKTFQGATRMPDYSNSLLWGMSFEITNNY
jgi:hypothetical protein